MPTLSLYMQQYYQGIYKIRIYQRMLYNDSLPNLFFGPHIRHIRRSEIVRLT